MSNRYLPLFISQVKLELSRVAKIDKAAVERDIAARRHEANVGKLFAYQRELQFLLTASRNPIGWIFCPIVFLSPRP